MWIYMLKYELPYSVDAGDGEGKFNPRTGHEGLEVEYKDNSTLSLTSARDEVDGQRHTPDALPPKKIAGTHCVGG